MWDGAGWYTEAITATLESGNAEADLNLLPVVA